MRKKTEGCKVGAPKSSCSFEKKKEDEMLGRNVYKLKTIM